MQFVSRKPQRGEGGWVELTLLTALSPFSLIRAYLLFLGEKRSVSSGKEDPPTFLWFTADGTHFRG
jgi:hypothetical protein